MSSELIILLTGAILIGITLIDSLISGAGPKGFINIRMRVILGVIGFILMIFGGYSFGTISTAGQIEQVSSGNKLEISYPIDKIQIISPLQNDSVDCRILTMGVYPKGHEKDIWILLKPSDEKNNSLPSAEV